MFRTLSTWLGIWLGVLGFASASATVLLDEYMASRVGSFTSEAQAAVDSRYDVAIWHIVEIWTDEDSEKRWLYVEAWLKDAKAPYMQRVSSIEDLGDGTLRSRRFVIGDTAPFLKAELQAGAMPGRGEVDLTELQGCEAILARAGIGRFEGGTIGNRCRNAYKGASYAISRSALGPDGMTNWDRGFSATGEHVWGPRFGGYRFERMGGEDSCSNPVRMLVYGEVFDRARFGAYGRALGESGLYPQNGGYYEAISPPLAVFEGDPPESRGVIIARFPCLQAAKNFWYSDAYEKIRPLREGIAEFEVIVLKAPPLPAYVDD